MRHETLPEAGPANAPDTAIRLSLLSSEIDQHFMPAGETLARLVDTVGTVLGGLDGIGRALGEDGAEAHAGRNLLMAARDLSEAPARQAQRAVQVSRMLAITSRLSEAAGEVLRLLNILRAYTVNLKIAGAGSTEFMDFALEMNLTLDEGLRQVDAVTKQIATMLVSLGEMRAVDEVLAQECRRVVPAVPDRLGREVERLQDWQRRLAVGSGKAQGIIMRLQTGVGKALEAIQIGDITRQRLEHVADGCERLDAVLREESEDPAGTRAHMLRLLAAQIEDLTGDFAEQSRALLAALHSLAPDCNALLGQQQQQGGLGDSGVFLGELDDCIGGAQGMTRQLRHADAKAAEISDMVVQGANVLRDRVAAVERLRFDVDYMAINVNIQARCNTRIGRPVAVIANEIRICSGQVANLANDIATIAEDLDQVSHSFEAELAQAGEVGVDEALATALATIRCGAQAATAAMAALDSGAQNIVSTIRSTIADLAVCDRLAEQLRAMTQELAAEAGGAAPQAGDDHPLRGLMQALARSYTMASERQVHDRFLLPGMEPLAAGSTNSKGSDGLGFDGDGDDDDLGDVFL